MEELPSNSHKAASNDGDKVKPKVVESVVSGKVIHNKPSLGKRFAATFFGGEARGVGGYLTDKVLIPALRDLAKDLVWEALERVLGNGRSNNQRGGGPRPSSGGSYTNYNRPSTSSAPWNRDRREEPRTLSRQARSEHDFGELIFDSKDEAERVLERLGDLISQYDSASVRDLYSLANISSTWADENWGWIDLVDADIRRIRNGYQLILPPTEDLRKK